MFTILGADGKEYGPVPADKIQSWITGGRANLQTKARREGEAEWKTLGDFPEFAAGTVPPPMGLPPAASPTVAAGSTADAITRSGPVDSKAYADDLIARSAKIDVFDILGQGFDLWKNNFWPLVGVTLLIFGIMLVMGLIPLLGPVARTVLTGVFNGGLYYYYLGKLRNQPRDVGDAFAGFPRAFVPLMLTGLITTVLVVAVMLASCSPFFFFLVKLAMHQHPPTPEFTPVLLLCCGLGGLVVLFLSIAWSFGIPLVIDKGLGPWTALEVSRRVVSRQWFRVFFVILLGGILTMLGFIGLFIGIVFTLPLVICAITCAYEAICNPPPKAG